MGFIGLIRLAALLLAVWLVWRFIARRNVKNSDNSGGRIDQKVVQCVVCGTHVPETEALSKNNEYFCSRAHLEQADNKNDPDQ